ncbi:MAG: hypothetical protein JWN70_2458 [Planctomycetaceae bacterium]|nr:hypothetical protein [Planctomycetaceae bacterium]
MFCHRRILGIVGLTLLSGLISLHDLPAGENDGDDFVLHESLGQVWRNECVRFELSPTQAAHVTAKHALIGPGNMAVPYQVITESDGTSSRIAFAASLNTFEERRYHFSDAPTNAMQTDLKIDERGEHLDLFNSTTGISLRRKLKAGEGPVAAIRLASGGWIGDSRLRTTEPIPAYTVEVTARGPVFVEAVCHAKFGQDRSWEIRFRVYAGEPVVLVEEKFTTDDDSTFQLALGTDYSPDRLFYRAGNDVVGKNATWDIDPQEKQPVFVLEPWLHWWERDRQGNWLGLYSSTGSNLLALGALEPGLWIDPSQPPEKRSATQILVTQADNDLWATFPLRGGQRKWLIASLDQDAALDLPPPPVGGRGPGVSKYATLPQKYLIKHGDFPLDRVKDATRAWTQQPGERARPLVSEPNIHALRKLLQPELLEKFRHSPIVTYAMDEPIAYYIATSDGELGTHLGREAVRLIQIEVDNFYRQDNSPTLGVEPHRRANEMLPAVNLAALMLGRDVLLPEQSRRLKSQLAFLADTVTRPDFYSPARGYSANPNMTSTVAGFQVRLAGAIPSHPKAAGWIAGGMNELKRELNQWSDKNGGWLEAPHYALVAYDTLLGCFLAAHLAGQDDVLFDPKMKLVANWLAKMSSPPDVRLNGWRHHLPIGNTYQGEVSSIYGHMAVIWRDKDPQFSANMQWMHQQAGSPTSPGIGGFYPTLGGFRTLLLDPGLPAVAPHWTSELFPETGVILRSGFPSTHETQLSLIAGRNHDHYDDDSGSITLWGKGSLLANDFGYTGHPSSEDHSMILSPSARSGNMRVEEFTTTERFDAVKGVRDGWTRHIAFIKDPDPLGHNYFVISDTLSKPAPLKWQLWLTASQVTTQPQAAIIQGRDDVDLDVLFTSPAKITLRTEEKSRNCLAMLANRGIDGGNVTTQTGLIAEVASGERITAVLFPRLKTADTPEVTSLADGKVLRIHSQAGTDYVFLSTTPFKFSDQDLSFEGTSGVIQLRGNTLILALGAAGRIAARQHELREDHATFKAWISKP